MIRFILWKFYTVQEIKIIFTKDTKIYKALSIKRQNHETKKSDFLSQNYYPALVFFSVFRGFFNAFSVKNMQDLMIFGIFFAIDCGRFLSQ